ncbi:Cupredoxin [Penicillium longicatenatum]|nr:Cupredoxin [Penicillium longicatenatum]
MNLISLYFWGLIVGFAVAIPQSPPTPTNASTTAANSTSTSCEAKIDRASWCSYTINTDYEETAPYTGMTREYWLTINNTKLSPDGYPRDVMTANGTIPGPTIFADWGDEVVVHVTNNLTDVINGTSLHFHGIRQNFTNPNDGVSSLTQCPIAPKSSMTYRWRAVQYGTSWYHSHYGLQAWEGVFGGIVIRGPASANYDEDRGMMFLNDWTHRPVNQLFDIERTTGTANPDNDLINGTNSYPVTNDTSVGKRFELSVTQGTSYRLRLVNSAINKNYLFQIDGHNLTVISMDLVPIKPYNTSWIHLTMGQRYDVILHADQASVAEEFWIRLNTSSLAQDSNARSSLGILYYGDIPATPKDPKTKETPTIKAVDIDEPLDSLIPVVAKNVPPPISSSWNRSLTTGLIQSNDTASYSWYLNRSTMHANWTNPTLLQLYNQQVFNDTIGPYIDTTSNGSTFIQSATNLIDIPTKNTWVYVNIISGSGTADQDAHPIHLHGHDFYILAQGNGTFNGITNTINPPRRDTALLHNHGYLIIAFKTDNPGVWLMHCHIGWHTEEGFALQFLERKDEIADLIDFNTLNQTCQAWSDYTLETNSGNMGMNISNV